VRGPSGCEIRGIMALDDFTSSDEDDLRGYVARRSTLELR